MHERFFRYEYVISGVLKGPKDRCKRLFLALLDLRDNRFAKKDSSI